MLPHTKHCDLPTSVIVAPAFPRFCPLSRARSHFTKSKRGQLCLCGHRSKNSKVNPAPEPRPRDQWIRYLSSPRPQLRDALGLQCRPESSQVELGSFEHYEPFARACTNRGRVNDVAFRQLEAQANLVATCGSCHCELGRGDRD